MKNVKINQRNMTPVKLLLALFAFASLSGCASSPEPRLYLMKSVSGPVISQGSSDVSVLVGPIVMPEHLKRAEIVYQSNTHNININEYDRWAESLERNMTSVITSNLATHLDTEKSFDYYANFSTQPDYIVRLNVTEFSRVAGDIVSLSVSWELINKSTRQNELHSESIKVPLKYSEKGENVGDVIAAMNTAINELSLIIAKQISAKEPQQAIL